MKSIALAVLVAALGGCAVVPVGPPVYVGGSIDYRYNSGHGHYYGPYDGGGYYRPYGGPRWR